MTCPHDDDCSPYCTPGGVHPEEEKAATPAQLERVRRAHARGRCPFPICGWATCPAHGGASR